MGPSRGARARGRAGRRAGWGRGRRLRPEKAGSPDGAAEDGLEGAGGDLPSHGEGHGDEHREQRKEHNRPEPEGYEGYDEAVGEELGCEWGLAGPPIGFWNDSWIRLQKNRGALISLAVIVVLFAMAFAVGPLVSPHSPYAQDLSRRSVGSTAEFWFGTGEFGRDMGTRVGAAPGPRHGPDAADQSPLRPPLPGMR